MLDRVAAETDRAIREAIVREVSKRAGVEARAVGPVVEVHVTPPANAETVAAHVERDRMLGGLVRRPIRHRLTRPADDGRPGVVVGWRVMP